MLHSRPCTLNCWTALNSNSLYDWNLLVRILNCLVAPNVFKITPRHGPRTENTYHVFPISPVHWRAGWTHRKHVIWQLPIVAVTPLHLRGSVFTEPLPRNGLNKPVVLLLRVGPCVCCGRCLAMDLHITILFLSGGLNTNTFIYFLWLLRTAWPAYIK
jgi:hypothetical protein